MIWPELPPWPRRSASRIFVPTFDRGTRPMPFLPQREPRPLTDNGAVGFEPVGLYLGARDLPLEVACYETPRQPTVAELRSAHASRVGGRPAPVIIVVLWGEGRAALAASGADEPFVSRDLDAAQVERLCDAALSAPDRHAARRILMAASLQLETAIPGLRNSGLFALHELETGVTRREDWERAVTSGRSLLNARGRALVERLGFTVQPLHGPGAAVLVARESKIAVAIFLERPDEIDPPSPRFNDISPVSYGLAQADRENLDYVVIAAGSTLRVYPVKPGIGVARRGRTETFVELNLDLLSQQHAGYLWLVASADALLPGGTFEDILQASAVYAADLGARLRERVYDEVVPSLASAIVRARRLRNPSPERLRETYEMALLVLFRLLFVAYAEDKELLPLHASAEYRRHSLKELATRLAEARSRGTAFAELDFYWTEVRQLWKAVDKGNRTWGVPPYNGGLFSTEDGVGAALDRIDLTDAAFAPALAALVLDKTAEGVEGPIDFRSLGVREFGTIYEGLLESELSVAETDLALDPKSDAYVPAKRGTEVVVRAGEVYLHNASGARKASGAYYTKDFAVEHLLERALEPALSDHLERLQAITDDRDASVAFFEFHVADIAMGSGHFLVSAIDHIERRFSNYLASRHLPGVSDELERLRRSAQEQLGPEWAGEPIEDTQLLRRQIARRCIFGVDLNPLAAELARLSIWIHTFVPGLPLSFLDANLVVGNSLVGIATFDEARDLLTQEDAEGGFDLFELSAETLLGDVKEPVARLGRLAEASAAEVKEAKRLHAQALDAVARSRDLFTVLTASRASDEVRGAVESRVLSTRFDPQGDIFSDALVRKAEKALAGLRVLHFPVAFPQVFLGRRGGFDVIVGNPPWEKKRVEELEFWARHAPGLRALSTAERNREVDRLRRDRPDLVEVLESEKKASAVLRELLREFPGMNTGHPDLFRAFSWRFSQLLARDGGYLGVVLPGDTFKIKGAARVRETFAQLYSRIDVQMLTNKGGWVFDDVHQQKLISLVVGRRCAGPNEVEYQLRPEVHARTSWPVRGDLRAGVVTRRWLTEYSPTLVLPILPRVSSIAILNQMMRCPRLRQHPVFPLARVYADFETFRDRDRWRGERSRGAWPVYKGESFDLWVPDTGTYFGFTPGSTIALAAHERRARANSNSPYARTRIEWRNDPATHPCHFPRVAFRNVTHRTNRRTMIAALIPPNVVTTETAPWVLWYTNDQTERREALLLAILNSIPTDWWIRRFVEGHVDEESFDSVPAPSVDLSHPIATALVHAAGRLSATDERFAEWGQRVGVGVGTLRAEDRLLLECEIDAGVSLLYGLTEGDIVHIYETFHEGWDYEQRLGTVIKQFQRLTSLA